MRDEPLTPSTVRHTAEYKIGCPHGCGLATVTVTLDDHRSILDLQITCDTTTPPPGQVIDLPSPFRSAFR